MPSGIRTTVEFAASDVCPVADLSARAGTTIDAVCTNVCPSGDGPSVVEFAMDADCDPDLDADLTPVFSHGSTTRYRLTLDGESRCPCRCLARLGCPVARYVARDGTLTLDFHTTEYDQLREVVAELREQFPCVDIKRFLRSPAEDRSRDRVLVDRGRLTARQLEVLATAHEMGYFERPRRSNATEIAERLGINPSTFREHLAAAESKLLDDLL